MTTIQTALLLLSYALNHDLGVKAQLADGICSFCKKAGVKSTVHIRDDHSIACPAVAVSCDPYFDENGNYVTCKANPCIQPQRIVSCSRGHVVDPANTIFGVTNTTLGIGYDATVSLIAPGTNMLLALPK